MAKVDFRCKQSTARAWRMLEHEDYHLFPKDQVMEYIGEEEVDVGNIPIR